MADESLRYFMRPREEIVVELPAPPGQTDDKGERLTLKVRKLPFAKIQEIYERYTIEKASYDNRGKVRVQGNYILKESKYDGAHAMGAILAEAFVYPDLKSPELAEHFNCYSHDEMARHVWPISDEYAYISEHVADILGLNMRADDEDLGVKDAREKAVVEVKNSSATRAASTIGPTASGKGTT